MHMIGRASSLGFLMLLIAYHAIAQTYDGYTLYSPNGSTRTYLIDMNKNIVKTWTHSISGGYATYLLEDGSIMRPALSSNSSLGGGGEAGIVQRVAWDGTLLWQYTYSSSTVRTHHDICPMPNGNVLLIAWESKTASQAVAAGSKTSSTFLPDHIIEVQPTGTYTGNIVWQWHMWDHLIQDYNSQKSNYGVVADHPELFDINMASVTSGGGWSHVNGISFDSTRNQIVFSSHNLNEIYVIDHSTTTAEAASHAGGTSGNGGDILYRWGCPSNYRASGTQVFKVVHSAVWIPDDLPGGGNIMAFNNRENQGTSMVVELVPPIDGAGAYIRTAGTAFGPASPTWSYTASDFYSNHLGGCQRLPNGNTLIVESTSGYMFEVTAAGTRAWEYNPGGEIVRALRYPASYAGLKALGTAASQSGTTMPSQMTLSQNYPNPFNPVTTITFGMPETTRAKLEVFNLLGDRVATLLDGEVTAGYHSIQFDASHLASGTYFYRLTSGTSMAVRKLAVVR
jgi:hypothetical protein